MSYVRHALGANRAATMSAAQRLARVTYGAQQLSQNPPPDPTQPTMGVIGPKSANVPTVVVTPPPTSTSADGSTPQATVVVGGAPSSSGTTVTYPTTQSTPPTVYVCPDGSQVTSPNQCPSTPPAASSIPWFWIGAGALALWLLSKGSQ